MVVLPTHSMQETQGRQLHPAIHTDIIATLSVIWFRSMNKAGEVPLRMPLLVSIIHRIISREGTEKCKKNAFNGGFVNAVIKNVDGFYVQIDIFFKGTPFPNNGVREKNRNF